METKLVVGHRLGLHARPAAAFVQTAARYRAAVTISNLSGGRGPASARSILAVMGLGIRQGDEVLLQVEGDDAAPAMAALTALLVADETSEASTPTPGSLNGD